MLLLLRTLTLASRTLGKQAAACLNRKVTPLVAKTAQLQTRQFSLLKTPQPSTATNTALLAKPEIQKLSLIQPSNRTITKFSLRNGKRKSDRFVLCKFYRLNWGIWIRTKCGRKKKMWKKTAKRKTRIRRHVFCNASQSWLLDKMVTKCWKRPKFYVDDPYEPYHTREEFQYTYRKPRPLES